MKKKCKWLTHKWEFTGGQGTDVYEHPRRCTRCELTDTYIDGVTPDVKGRLFHVVRVFTVVLLVSLLLWFLYRPT